MIFSKINPKTKPKIEPISPPEMPPIANPATAPAIEQLVIPTIFNSVLFFFKNKCTRLPFLFVKERLILTLTNNYFKQKNGITC